MYKSFEIKNFKCFEHLKLENLARVNLIAGKNSVGKSALLEALYQHCDGQDAKVLLDVVRKSRRPFRLTEEGSTMESICRGIFFDFDTSSVITMAGSGDSDAHRTVRLSMVHHGRSGLADPLALELESEDSEGKKSKALTCFHGSSVNTDPRYSAVVPVHWRRARHPVDVEQDAKWFTKSIRNGSDEKVAEVLQIIEPRLKRLELLVDDGPTLIHGRIGLSQPLPLAEMGDGVVLVANLIMIMANYRDGVLLLDEIENGLHYSILEDVWRAIGEAARQFNVQVFATTHSYECIAAANEAFKESKAEELAFYRLVEIDGKIENTRYSTETFAGSIDTGWELR